MLAGVVFATFDRANNFFRFQADFNSFIGLRGCIVAGVRFTGDSRRVDANIIFVRTRNILAVFCGEHEAFCFARFELGDRIRPGIILDCAHVCLDERYFHRRIVGNDGVFQRDFASFCLLTVFVIVILGLSGVGVGVTGFSGTVICAVHDVLVILPRSLIA